MPQGRFEKPSMNNNENAVAIVEQEAEISVQPVYSSTPQMDPSTFDPPKLRLAQGLTQEVQDGEAKVGQYVLEMHPPKDSVVFTPVTAATTRIYARGRGEEFELLCQSGDAQTGVGQIWDKDHQLREEGAFDPRDVHTHDCKTCPFAQWTPNPKTGKNKPPLCSLSSNYVGFSFTHETIVKVAFKGTSQGVAKKIDGLAFTKRGYKNVAVNLVSKTIGDGANRYAVSDVRIAEMTPEMQEIADRLHQAFQPDPSTEYAPDEAFAASQE